MQFLHGHGQTARDVITGFEGVITGRVDYITGCNQYLVQPKVASDGAPREPRWIDEQRLEILTDVPAITIDNERNGADAPAPVK